MLQSLVEVTAFYSEAHLRTGDDAATAANNVNNMRCFIQRAFEVQSESK